MESEEGDVWYYSTVTQFEELLKVLDENEMEAALCRELQEYKPEVVRQMELTEKLTNQFKGNKKTYFDVANGICFFIYLISYWFEYIDKFLLGEILKSKKEQQEKQEEERKEKERQNAEDMVAKMHEELPPDLKVDNSAMDMVVENTETVTTTTVIESKPITNNCENGTDTNNSSSANLIQNEDSQDKEEDDDKDKDSGIVFITLAS